MEKYQLHILYLHNRSKISGGERGLLNLWINLDKSRFIPFLMIPESGELSDAAAEIGIIADYHVFPQIRPHNFLKITKSIKYLTEYIRQNKIAIIHSYTPRNNIIGALAAKICKIPILWHERNLLYAKELDVSRLLSYLPDKIICNSNAVAQRFYRDKTIPAKVITIHNGVNTALFIPARNIKNTSQNQSITIGAATNLDYRKGAHLIPDIAAKVLEHITDVKFIVLGGGLNEHTESRLLELRKSAADKKIDQNITFTGFTEHVPEYMRSFDIFIHVTRNEYRDACSRAILEAQASGVPVVAFNNGGNSEIVEDNVTGILVPPCDLDKFSEAILTLIRNPEMRKSMAQQARKRVENHFNVRFNATLTQSLYEEVAGNSF